jgi:hypothetical protein
VKRFRASATLALAVRLEKSCGGWKMPTAV